jgi:hypothetical protein
VSRNKKNETEKKTAHFFQVVALNKSSENQLNKFKTALPANPRRKKRFMAQ